jgi:hypothetical protein
VATCIGRVLTSADACVPKKLKVRHNTESLKVSLDFMLYSSFTVHRTGQMLSAGVAPLASLLRWSAKAGGAQPVD